MCQQISLHVLQVLWQAGTLEARRRGQKGGQKGRGHFDRFLGADAKLTAWHSRAPCVASTLSASTMVNATRGAPPVRLLTLAPAS